MIYFISNTTSISTSFKTATIDDVVKYCEPTSAGLGRTWSLKED